MNFIWFIGFIIVFVLINKIQNRIATLERKTSLPAIQSTPQTSQTVAPVVPHSYPVPPRPLTAATPPAPPQGPTPMDQFTRWLKEDWLLKLGALLLLMGLGWFIAYAFSNNWVGPMGRIGIGVLFGALAMLLGAIRMKNYIHQGEIFMVTGATTIMFTLYAARSVYNFFTPTFVLICIGGVAVIVAALSIYRNSNPLALSSLAMALLAPLFVASVQPNNVGLLTYLLVVTLGTMWVVTLRQQRTLVPIALVGVWWYSLGIFLPFSGLAEADKITLYVLASALAVIFFGASVLYYARGGKGSSAGDVVEVLTSIAIGLFVYEWTRQMIVHDTQAAVLLAWATVFIVGGLYAYGLSKRPEPIYLFGGVGVVLLGIATSIQFEGHTLAILWTLEAALLSIGTLLLTRKRAVADKTVLAFVVPIFHTLQFISFSSVRRLDDAAVFGLLSLVLFVAGGLFALSWDDDDKSPISTLLISAGMVYAFIASAALWHGAELTIVWTLLAVAAPVVAFTITHRPILISALSLSFLPPAVRSMEHIYASTWDTGVLHMDALALLFIATGLCAIGALLNSAVHKESVLDKQNADTSVVFMTIGSFYYMIILWLSAPTLFGHEYAVMGSLVIYTIVGLSFYVRGHSLKNAYQSMYGAAVLGFVVIRLLLVDVWQMELSGRIVTFLLIGTLLVTTAFIGKRPSADRSLPV